VIAHDPLPGRILEPGDRLAVLLREPAEEFVGEELMALLQGGGKAGAASISGNGAGEDKPGRAARRSEPAPARSSAKKSTAKRSR
jgi:hypothetical protein